MAREELLLKAERSIKSARLLLSDGDVDGAASRLYYAMFYIAEALLDAKGLSFSSHGALQAAFGQHLARTGEIDPRYHRALLHAFLQRQLGDYSTTAHVAPGIVEVMAEEADAFVLDARAWLARSG